MFICFHINSEYLVITPTPFPLLKSSQLVTRIMNNDISNYFSILGLSVSLHFTETGNVQGYHIQIKIQRNLTLYYWQTDSIGPSKYDC